MTTQVQTSEGTEMNARYCYMTSSNYNNKSKTDFLDLDSEFVTAGRQRGLMLNYIKGFYSKFLGHSIVTIFEDVSPKQTGQDV